MSKPVRYAEYTDTRARYLAIGFVQYPSGPKILSRAWVARNLVRVKYYYRRCARECLETGRIKFITAQMSKLPAQLEVSHPKEIALFQCGAKPEKHLYFICGCYCPTKCLAGTTGVTSTGQLPLQCGTKPKHHTSYAVVTALQMSRHESPVSHPPDKKRLYNAVRKSNSMLRTLLFLHYKCLDMNHPCHIH